MKQAAFYHKDGECIRCQLCPHECYIKENHTGACRVRMHKNGVLWSLNYGECAAYALDPIEKKPLYHFHPGKAILSLGARGCNFSCAMCQNHQLAHGDIEGEVMEPREVVITAQKLTARGNIGIAFTYAEPSVWYEFVYDTAELAHHAGLKNVLVTNGFIRQEPLRKLLPFIDALNIDVKGFTKTFYRDTCGGDLEAVKRTVEIAAKSAHVEITTLLIPGLNDNEQEIHGLAQWLGSISRDIPLHFTRYFPGYKMANPPTPLAVLARARDIAGEYLRYVYTGNVTGEGNNTYCYACGMLVVDRIHRTIALTADRHCPVCNSPIQMVIE